MNRTETIALALGNLCQSPGWKHYQDYKLICAAWEKIGTAKQKENCRPLWIKQGHLYCATNGATWAQHLGMQRRSLLKSLKAETQLELIDIRFSSAQWYLPEPQETETINPHPLLIEGWGQEDPVIPEDLSSFARFIVLIQAKYSNLTEVCPECGAPAGEFELARWGCCQHCSYKERNF